MAFKTSDTVANAMLNAFETAIGTSPILRIRSGAAPANCAASDAGTVLATLNLPSDWMQAAASRSKAKAAAAWEDLSADATGTCGHYRIYASDGVTCHAQGTVTEAGGGGDMIVSNASLDAGQTFEVTVFQINDNNA